PRPPPSLISRQPESPNASSRPASPVASRCRRMSEPSLRERSAAAFAKRLPDLAQRLNELPPSSITVDLVDGRPVDLRVEGRPLYGPAAGEIALAQAGAYLDKPIRITMERPRAVGLLTPVCQRLFDDLRDELAGRGIDELARNPSGHPAYLVVFGLGL